jgi:hypothetical protein
MQIVSRILTGYCMLCTLCYLVMDWDYRTRAYKVPSLSPDKFPHRKVIMIMSILPVINVRIVAKILSARLQERVVDRRVARNRKKLADTLRERAKDYEKRGLTAVSQSFNQIADKIENPS